MIKLKLAVGGDDPRFLKKYIFALFFVNFMLCTATPFKNSG